MNKSQQWTVDACEDANGFSTLRVYDGGEHGDTSQEPIATVYIEENAQRIVACVNACAPLTSPETQIHSLQKLATECVKLRAEVAVLRAFVQTHVNKFGAKRSGEKDSAFVKQARAVLTR